MGPVTLIDCAQDFFKALALAAAVLTVEMILAFREAYNKITKKLETELPAKARTLTRDRLWTTKLVPGTPVKRRESSNNPPRKRISHSIIADKICDNDRDVDTDTRWNGSSFVGASPNLSGTTLYSGSGVTSNEYETIFD